jgi:hypothetical protein
MVPINTAIFFIGGFLWFILMTPVIHALHWLGDTLPDGFVRIVRAYLSFIWTFFPQGSFFPTYSSLAEALRLGLTVALVVGLAAGIGVLAGIVTAMVATRGFIDFAGALDYLKAMTWPVIGFFVGFFLILVIFAGIYGSIAKIDPASFIGNDRTTNFGDFAFFSLMTLTSLGYSELVPVSMSAKFVTSLQAFLSVAWIIVVFAAVIAYVEPRFRALRERIEADRLVKSGSWEPDPEFSGFRNGLLSLKDNYSYRFRNLKKRVLSTRDSTTPSSTDEDSGNELPPDDISGVAVSFPFIGIEKISIDVENDRLKLHVELEDSKLWFTLNDVVISTGPRPSMSVARFKELSLRTPRRARRFTLVLPVTEDPTDWGYQLSGNYVHAVLQGVTAVPDRSRITPIVHT